MGQICSTSKRPTLTPPASPRFSRLPSNSSLTIKRKLPAPNTLLELCIDTVADNLERFDINILPDDMVQLVYDRLEASGALRLDLLRRFDPKSVHRAQLGFYGDLLDDQWMLWLGMCSGMLKLSMPNCSAVNEESMAHLYALSKLRQLDLANCAAVTDASLFNISGMSLLQQLCLKGCDCIEGPGLQHLSLLSQLERLDLSQCGGLRSGLPHLAPLKALRSLLLGGCHRLPARQAQLLPALPALTQLDASGTQVGHGGAAGLQPVAALMALEELDLAGSSAAGGALAALAPLRRLRSLSLERCAVGDGGCVALAAAAGGWRLLTRLELAYSGAGNAGVAAVAAGMTNLRRLGLEACHVSDGGCRHIAALECLESLDLSDCSVGDAGLGHLAELGAQLRSIDLSGTAVTDAGCSRHLPALVGLTKLLLESNARPPTITLATAAAITGLTALQQLDLSGAAVGAAGCRFISRHLTLLSRLQLAGSGVTDDGCRHLAALVKTLVDLNLSQNPKIGDAGAAALCGLTGLRNLSLCDTGVGNGGCAKLGGSLQGLQCFALVGSKVDAAAAEAAAAALPFAAVKWRPVAKK